MPRNRRVENAFLVFLHVLAIGKRQAFQDDQKAVQRADDPAGLARTSSAASGLRFCGMIDEPVVKASDRLMKLNLSEHQITISSARRDM